ncbi:hypothetical protein KP79_PYT01132 [Mizuhopecten yessoensis]|uniref:Uncharacterized protein n=1 Tax=Mizuhopecten yessoensis TaxID=6573 RepID=A0A210QJ32_MIZYE|nr:hypothetical protein KP79_PYT01132 [Mizuhopecten yessoensis]
MSEISPITQSEESAFESNIISNLKDLVTVTKKRRSNEARATMNLVSASISGENLKVTKTKTHAAKRLGFQPRRVYGGYKKRLSVFTSENASLLVTTRKVRSDAVSMETKNSVYNWWTSPHNARPTGNKVDIKRKRTGLRAYVSHPILILEKTQTEIYNEFKTKNPPSRLANEFLKNYDLTLFVKCERKIGIHVAVGNTSRHGCYFEDVWISVGR